MDLIRISIGNQPAFSILLLIVILKIYTYICHKWIRMAGNTFGNLFKVTTFGESHGIAIGGIIDGCPVRSEVRYEGNSGGTGSS